MTSTNPNSNVAPATHILQPSSSQSTGPLPSRDSTRVDLQAYNDSKKSLDEHEMEKEPRDRVDEMPPFDLPPKSEASGTLPRSDDSDTTSTTSKPEGSSSGKTYLPPRRRWALLAIFSLAMFIDIWCYSAFFIFTRTISADLNILHAQESWVITSYAVTFASFLLFWGRVSDLYSAKPVFTYGFVALGILNLVISFLPNRYAFFILRAVAGIAGSALIPASYRLIVHCFPKEQLGLAFTLYGMSGAISNVTGTIVAGFFEFIPNDHGVQMQSWRWFFRLLAVMILPMALLGFFWIPKEEGEACAISQKEKIKRLDLVGSLLMLSAIVLLTLGLTLGASYGFKTAKFLVPFLLSWALFPAFFVWEAKIPQSSALLPAKTWKIPNFAVLIGFALQLYAWWGVNFLAFVDTFTNVRHERAIIAALRILPQGVVAFMVTLFLTKWPQFVKKPRWPIAAGMVLGIVGYVLMTRPTQYDNQEYWRFLFPGFVVGSGGMMVAFTATNVGVMTSVPPHMAGVAGAVLQVAFQIGSTVGLSVQAGLLTVGSWPNNVKASFYFQMGWNALWLVLFLALYRPNRKQADDEETVVAAAH